MNNDDLILISLNAHFNYLYPRIGNDSKREGFKDCFNDGYFSCDGHKRSSYIEGAQLWKDVKDEVTINLTNRFDLGYSNDYINGFTKL